MASEAPKTPSKSPLEKLTEAAQSALRRRSQRRLNLGSSKVVSASSEDSDYDPENKYYLFSEQYLSFDKRKNEKGKEEVDGKVLQTLILLLDVQRHFNQQNQGGTEAEDKKEWENALIVASHLANFDSEKKQNILDLKNNETARLDFLIYRMGNLKGDSVSAISTAARAADTPIKKKQSLYSDADGHSKIGEVPQTRQIVKKQTPQGYTNFLEEIKKYIKDNPNSGFEFLQKNVEEPGVEENKAQEDNYEVVHKFLENAYGQENLFTNDQIDIWWTPVSAADQADEETKESTSTTALPPVSAEDPSPPPVSAADPSALSPLPISALPQDINLEDFAFFDFEQDEFDQPVGGQQGAVPGQQQGAAAGQQQGAVAGQQQGAVAGQQQQGGGANSAGEIDDQEITDVAPTGAFDPLPPEQLKSLQLDHFGYAAKPDTYSTLKSRGTTGYGQDDTRTQAVMPFSNAMKSIPKDANANLNLQFKQQIKNSGYFVGPYSVVDVSKQTDERASKQPEQEILQPAAKRYAKLNGKIVWIPFHVRAAQTFFQEADYSELASFVVEQDNQLKLSPPPKNLPGNMMMAIKTFRNNLTNMLGLNTTMPKFNSIEDRYAEWLELKQFGKAYARYCETSAGKYNTLSLFSGNLRDAISKAVSESAERLGLTKRKAPDDDKPSGVRGLDQYGKNQPLPLENMETNPFFLPPVNDVKRQRTTFSRFY